MKVQSNQPMLKRRLQHWILPVSIFLIFFSSNFALAQTNIYWDTSITNGGIGGSGNLSSSGNNWATNSLGAAVASGGPTGNALFTITNSANGVNAWASGNYFLNFGGTAGTVTNGGSYQMWGINILTNGYVFTIDGTGVNGRTLTMTNGFDLGANTITFANGARGTNSYTFAGPSSSGWTGISNGITASPGALIVISHTNPLNLTNLGFYISSGGSLSSNAPINIITHTNARVMLGSQSSGGANFNSSITNNSAGGSPLELTNSSSGTVAFNGVISGANGLVLNNSSSGKIVLSASNTYSGGTTINNTNGGEVQYSNIAAFGSGAITSSLAGTNYMRSLASGLTITNAIAIGTNNTLRVGTTTNTTWSLGYSGVISGSGSLLYSLPGILTLSSSNSSFGGGFTIGSSGQVNLSKIGMAGQNSSIGTNGVITAGLITTPTSRPQLRWNGTTNETSDKDINIGNATGGLELRSMGDGDLTLNGNVNSLGLGGPKTILLSPTTNSSAGTTHTLSLNGVINDGIPGYGVNGATIGSNTIITNIVGGATNLTTNVGVTSITFASVAGVTNGAAISGGNCISPGTTITAVDTVNRVITLSQATTNTNSISVGLAVMNVAGATAATSLNIEPKSSAGATFVNVALGNTNNSFSGPVIFTNAQSGLSSILRISKFGNPGENSSLGTASDFTIGGANGSTCTLDYTGSGEVSSKTIILGGLTGTVGLSQSGSGLLKLTGSILPGSNSGARKLVLSGSSSGAGELASNLENLGANALSIEKSGAGTWTLTGSNSYTGNTTIAGAGGILQIMSVNSLSPNTVLLGSGSSSTVATLDLGNAGDYVANSYGSSNSSGSSMFFSASSGSDTTLTFTNAANFLTRLNNTARNLTNNSVKLSVIFTGTFDIGSSGDDNCGVGGVGNFTFNNSITNSGVGTRGLVKGGSGRVILNASNSYNGLTTVSGGTLEVGAAGALPVTSAVIVSNRATLKFLKTSGVINLTNLTVSSGGTLEQNLVTITSSGAVNLTGSTLKVNETPTADEYILVSGNSVTGTPILIGADGYELKNENNSIKLVKTVVVSGSTFDTTYSPGSEEAVGPNGLKNLMNYALGGTALNPSPDLPVLTIDANGLTLTANIRNDDNSGLTVDGEYADSLEGPWTKVKQEEWNPDANSSVPNLTVKSFTRAFGSQPRQFLRFRVTK